MKSRVTALSSPVVSFLSPSPSVSRKAQSILSKICRLDKVNLSSAELDDNLNKSFRSIIPGFSQSWESVALKCPMTGTLVHFLSGDKLKNGHISLLGITDVLQSDSSEEAIRRFRDLFALEMNQVSSYNKMKSTFGVLGPEDLLGSISNGGLPLLSLPKGDFSSDEVNDEFSGLKEVTIPFFDFAEYNDGSSLLSKLSNSKLKRQVVGVYNWGSSRIRPLPTASEDRAIPPASIVFHCENLADMDTELPDVIISKIGYGGNGTGQLMLKHEALKGLDVRFCSSTAVSSAFFEAQESLLAASLSDLQSTNTLLKGGEEAKDDDRIGKADCWVEVRANLKQPSGFLKRPIGSTTATQRVAGAPNTPDQ